MGRSWRRRGRAALWLSTLGMLRLARPSDARAPLSSAYRSIVGRGGAEQTILDACFLCLSRPAAAALVLDQSTTTTSAEAAHDRGRLTPRPLRRMPLAARHPSTMAFMLLLLCICLVDCAAFWPCEACGACRDYCPYLLPVPRLARVPQGWRIPPRLARHVISWGADGQTPTRRAAKSASPNNQRRSLNRRRLHGAAVLPSCAPHPTSTPDLHTRPPHPTRASPAGARRRLESMHVPADVPGPRYRQIMPISPRRCRCRHMQIPTPARRAQGPRALPLRVSSTAVLRRHPTQTCPSVSADTHGPRAPHP